MRRITSHAGMLSRPKRAVPTIADQRNPKESLDGPVKKCILH
jgi:hypothetical protein